MTFKTGARIRETSTTTGAGTYTLDGAPAGYQAFSSLGANNLCPYFATDGVNWEEGIGTVLTGPNRLDRTHVLASSNAGAAVNWGVGTRTLRCGPIASIALPRTLSKSVAGGAGTTTLTQDEQRRDMIEFTGALTGNRTIEVDATPWSAVVYNNTTGNFTLTVKVTGQTGVVLPQAQGHRRHLYCDGVDVREVDPALPPGAIVDYGGGAVPAGYLLCDGSNQSRSTFQALFAAIGTTWGAGDGSTTFGVPDLRRRATIGSGGTAISGPANTVGSVGGAETHALSLGEVAAHTHGPGSLTADSAGAHGHALDGFTLFDAAGGNGVLVQSGVNAATPLQTTAGGAASAGTHGHSISGSSASTGSGTAHNNMQPSAVVTKMIKV
jgi:microcystin-dependent protein